jgi:phosphatidylglycerophosphate synthase
MNVKTDTRAPEEGGRRGRPSLADDYRKMSKPRDIEEVGDIYLIRPLGFLLVQFLRRTTATPTFVSFLALLAGWWTAYLYYDAARTGGPSMVGVIAFLAFLLHSALDSADGQLARITERYSSFGAIIDGLCDNLVFLAIYVAIVLGVWQRTGGGLLALSGLAVLAALSHSVQSSLVTYQRFLYLDYVYGKKDIEELAPDNLEREVRSSGSIFSRILRGFYLPYHHQQRFFLPSTHRLEQFLNRWVQQHSELAPELSALYAGHQRPLMRYWALMASNSHKLGIAVAVFLPVTSAHFWGSLGAGWYFVYDLFLNAVLVLLVAVQSRRNRKIREDVERIPAAAKGRGAVH